MNIKLCKKNREHQQPYGAKWTTRSSLLTKTENQNFPKTTLLHTLKNLASERGTNGWCQTPQCRWLVSPDRRPSPASWRWTRLCQEMQLVEWEEKSQVSKLNKCQVRTCMRCWIIPVTPHNQFPEEGGYGGILVTFVHAVVSVRMRSELLYSLAAQEAGVSGLCPERRSWAS